MQELPEAPDLAIIVVPAEAAIAALEDAGKRGARVGLIGASGFAESGEKGRERQQRLLGTARQYGVRLVGPNCNGVYNVAGGIPLGYNSSHGERLPAGRVAILAHSSALLGSLAHRSKRMGMGLSYLAGLGNEADLDMCDFVEFCIEDGASQAIGLLVEGLTDGARFLSLAERAREAGKTLVALKLGRSARGAVGVQSHSARMAGAAEVYAAAFRQHGVVATDSIETFLGALHLLSSQPPLGQGRVMIISTTGAGAEIMADKAEDYALPLAEVSQATREAFPDRTFAVSWGNPFETAGQTRQPGFLEAMTNLFAADPANDCLVGFLHELAMRETFARSFTAAARKHRKAAVMVVGEVGQAVQDIFREGGIPIFPTIDACLGTLQAVVATRPAVYEELAGLLPAAPSPFRGSSEASPAASGPLGEAASKALLARYGIQSASAAEAATLEEARCAAEGMGYPVILKGVVPGVAHKAAAGLVSGTVRDELALEAAYAAIQGSGPVSVSVEQFVEHELEVILGLKQDDVFGPAMLFGLGGIYTELLNEYVVRLPLAAGFDLAEMIAAARFAPLLLQAHRQARVDLRQLAETMGAFAALARDLGPRLVAADVNPVALLPDRALALDAKIELR